MYGIRPESRAGSIALRLVIVLIVAAGVVFPLEIALKSARPPLAGAGQTSAGQPSDEEVAKQLSITLDQVRRLHTERGLSNEILLQLPAKARARALARLDEPRPDNPGEAAMFRMLQEKDEEGIIPQGAKIKAFQQLQALRLNVPGAAKVGGADKGIQPKGLVAGPAPVYTVAGIPVGPLASTVAATQANDPHMMFPLNAGIQPGGWVWLGPGNIGGRTRSIVVHPNGFTMWAGSVGGGVWKSNNGGGSWAPLEDFMGNLAVSCMVLDPHSPPNPIQAILYAGTGEGFYNGDALRGAGIFNSIDGGKSWKHLPSTSSAEFQYVNRLAISADSKILLAATQIALFRSTDKGNTWKKLPAPVNTEILDVKFHPKDSQLCVAAGRNGKAYFSANGGQAWAAAGGIPPVAGFGGRTELTYAVANPKVVYASVDNNSGEVFRSLNGGAMYTRMNTGTHYLGGQGWYDNAVWAGDPKNVNLVVVGGLDLYRSTNAGTTFTQISQWWQAPASAHADHHVIVAHPQYDGVQNRIVFFGNDGGLYKANDVTTVVGTTGWQNLNHNYGVTQFYGAAGNVASGTIVAGAQDNGTLRFTTAGGAQAWTTMFGGDGGFGAADPTDPAFFYGEYVTLQIHRSTDGGATSSYIFSGIGDAGSNANFIAPFILDPNNPNTMLAGGASLWRSVNVKAQTPLWVNIKPSVNSFISAIAVQSKNSNVIWVGHNDGRIYKTSKGAAPTLALADWTQVGAAALPKRYCTRVTLDASDPKKVVAYATFGGYSKDNVWKSVDGGLTWTDIGAKLPEAPVRSLVVHPTHPKYLYIGTEVGIFASEDSGATWSPTNQGPTNCSVDELFFMGNNLVAVTHGRGVFRINLATPTPPPPGANVPAGN
jgi:photosystem II stability/assembly factor-like uncharacterized protein